MQKDAFLWSKHDHINTNLTICTQYTINLESSAQQHLECLCFPLFQQNIVFLFVLVSTDIVAMGNRTILSSSLVPLYIYKGFWLVNLFWEKNKTASGKQPTHNDPPAFL